MKLSDIYNSICIDSSVENKNCILQKIVFYLSDLIETNTALCLFSCMGLVEEKYNVLRKRLDQLGYRQTLDISTVPLVEKLFADLLHTTESFKASKQHTASLKVINYPV